MNPYLIQFTNRQLLIIAGDLKWKGEYEMAHHFLDEVRERLEKNKAIEHLLDRLPAVASNA